MSDIPERFNLARWLLEPNLEHRPDKVAVRFEEREWTYRRVAEETARVQGAFQALGLQPEQRVLMVLPDVPEFVST